MVMRPDVVPGSYLLTASILTDDPDSEIQATREIHIVD
jgi:hypothetical protein